MDESGTVIFHSAHPLIPVRYKDGPLRAVSWGGIRWKPDARGVIMVPVEAVRELTESHGMEGVPDVAIKYEDDPVAVAELSAAVSSVAPLAGSSEPLPQRKGRRQADSTEGGAVRPTVFPPVGDHPEGGPQPALTEIPNEDAVKASQSQAPRE